MHQHHPLIETMWHEKIAHPFDTTGSPHTEECDPDQVDDDDREIEGMQSKHDSILFVVA
jgi:hypothetical protein